MPAKVAKDMVEALEDVGISVSAYDDGREPGIGDGPWRIELVHEREPDPDDLQAWLAPIAAQVGLKGIVLEVEPLARQDWLQHNAAQFPPQQAGRFWVHGSHVEEAPPEGSVPILIDAGAAFGSGDHGSTRGCLIALDRIARRRRFRKVLDVGCGSGILAIAAAKCWRVRALAVDLDPRSVEIAAENAARNGVADSVRSAESDGFQQPLIGALAPYDLIFLNILAEPLVEMAPDVGRALAPGGFVVLSGLLDGQAPAVLDAYRAERMRLAFRVDLGPWATLVLRARPGEGRRLSLLGRTGARLPAHLRRPATPGGAAWPSPAAF